MSRVAENYATGPDAAAARALGFPLAKLTLPEGDTRAGLHRSIDFLMHQREAVGPDYPIAVDCWGGLEPALAAEFAAMVRPINLAWLEEPFIGEAVEHCRHLKRAAPWLTVASGEHVQSHREFIDLIEAGVDYIQPDLRWCGGITGARAISPLILERGRALMPHTAGVYSYHFAAGTPGCGMVEYSNPSPDGKSLPPYHGGEFIGEPLPDSGVVSLEDRPGFGLVKVEPQVSSWV